ncbi:MAG TPA: glycosyltransferase family 2 protein [Stellaceae bacterium]|nr:glycosyltransferase family 2 protein [Stellaceae bacterium]
MSAEARLSALVVVHNEERQLAACLSALSFADEIVVVLDRCTDRSREIAAGFTGQLHEGAWELEAARRNFGIECCAGPWVLEVDADERVSAELAAEIRAAVATPDHDRYLIPVDNYIGATRVRYGWGGGFGKSAYHGLFRKGCKLWGKGRIHPAIQLSGRQGPTLTVPLVHLVDRNISDMLARLDRYTTARACDLREFGDRDSTRTYIRRGFTRAYKCYVTRKGYREGTWGVLLAILAGLYPLLSHLKAKLEPDAPVN